MDSKAYAKNSYIYGVAQKTEHLDISKVFHLKMKWKQENSKTGFKHGKGVKAKMEKAAYEERQQ